ncbi:MAG: oligoribonuclease [Zoogloeaceae bacterium]|jgi:oligoribonuclease|nr:oligoribonuclease [Zoogloeaceae bacterium]
MVRDAMNLIWLDMEMTGLDPEHDKILELAIVATDTQLNILGESPSWVVHQSDATLAAMDDWNQKTHGRSGLVERVKLSTLDEQQVEQAALAFVEQFAPAQASPMCGNTIGQDRRFMARHMPTLEAWFHYRNLDVSTLKELCKRWTPEVYKGFQKKGAHTAMADVLESIDELKFYRQNFIRC